ncbi:MAG: nucleotidyltransferase domain-containing protein [Desulfovermiculus sp.]|nr:nucleotidyltransferase domain-containing protein [Desulfovermiculus sp.]
MDKKQARTITKQFISSLTSEIQPRKIVFYGSWVHGYPDEESDIDIAVIFDLIENDYLDMLTKIYQIASKVDIHIEPVLFEENRDPSGFLLNILEQGEVVYEQCSET